MKEENMADKLILSHPMKKYFFIFLFFCNLAVQAQLLTQREIVLQEISRRPSDPWPRGEGHVVLAIPGSLEGEKAYLEPGGSFSPSFGSFGISIWSTDKHHFKTASGDDWKFEGIHQTFAKEKYPSVYTQLNDYETTHTIYASYDCSINIKNTSISGKTISAVIRSVGPAGAPIQKLLWDGKKLIINDAWNVAITPAPEYVSLGDETLEGWKNIEQTSNFFQTNNGWGFARIGLGSAEYTLHIYKIAKAYTSPIHYGDIFSTIKIQLPDKRFEQSLNAQVAHLMMCTVRDECRPGEPNNYPLPWLRDGAYILTVLARSGQIEAAKTLALYFAKNDFFGGFGPEADAPGLAIWGIVQVAYEANDPAFENEIWPHVKRKVELIYKMLHAKEAIRIPITGIVLKQTRQSPDSNLVCEASSDGLIIGRMDWHRPVTFVNSVSYSGLKHAALLAEKMNQPEAAEWKKAATDLQQAWIKGFDTYWDNDRTYICSFWPDWIAAPIKQKYIERAEGYWKSVHDSAGNYKEKPLWTYFNFSDAHQWLLLRQPNKSWNTLEYFWNHQSSPGLYTWWEGNGEENNSGRWQNVCGWIKPQNVTPHCWTAAEALALQLDMLAFIDESGSQPLLVIGEGIKKEWLTQPMKIEGLRVHGNIVNWNWDGKKLNVQIKGKKMMVMAGTAFPTKVKLTVTNL